MLFSLTLLPSIIVSMIYADGQVVPFRNAMGLLFALGLVIWFPTRSHRSDLRVRDGFLITVLFWVLLGISGAAPFYFNETIDMSFTDSAFESISGLTTTGATVLTNIDELPESVRWYRQQLQWFGGMGIIVLAVAILPMLGVGGMQLYRAETPGPVKDNKLTPRITETAKALWYIYLTMTIVCAFAYYFAGMSVFDAIGHSFATIAIGGFSTHDASIGYFDNPAIELICIFFMFASSINFALHFFAWRERSIAVYLRDAEFIFYFKLLSLVSLVTIGILLWTDTYSFGKGVVHGLFQVVSVATTTGFGVADFAHWPLILPFLLFVVAFIGGCAGSTAGGMKVMRVLLVYKQGAREIKRLVHPSAVFRVKLGKRPVSDRILEAVWGFIAVYILSFIVMQMILLATGLDLVTAWSAVGAAINNLGPGLGDVAFHYGDINSVAKWTLCVGMLLGRLEVFTLLILFTPAFWRR